MQRQFRNGKSVNEEAIDDEFRRQEDPFHYASNGIDRVRFRRQIGMIDSVRMGGCFERALEIGCAEGMFTEMIAERCQYLLAVDISQTALARARQRLNWGPGVFFKQWDLVRDSIPGTFDLIIAAGVLEYQLRLKVFKIIRAKLVAALRPGGHLLVQSTKVNPVVEKAWWSKYLVRGERINMFISNTRHYK